MREFAGKMLGTKIGTQSLCEPAQWKCIWTCHKWQEPYYAKKQVIGTHVLHEPARSKCTWTSKTNHFMRDTNLVCMNDSWFSWLLQFLSKSQNSSPGKGVYQKDRGLKDQTGMLFPRLFIRVWNWTPVQNHQSCSPSPSLSRPHRRSSRSEEETWQRNRPWIISNTQHNVGTWNQLLGHFNVGGALKNRTRTHTS